MDTFLWVLIVVSALLASGVLWLVLAFDRLMFGRFDALEKWADVEEQLERRHAVARGLAESADDAHAERIADLCRRSREADMHEKAAIEKELVACLRALRSADEARGPGDELMARLMEVEHDLRTAQHDYVESAEALNRRAKAFPACLVAGVLGARSGEPFEVKFVIERGEL